MKMAKISKNGMQVLIAAVVGVAFVVATVIFPASASYMPFFAIGAVASTLVLLVMIHRA